MININSPRAAKVYFVPVWRKLWKDKLSEVELLQHFLRLRNLSRAVCCEGLTCRKASCRVWTKLLPWKKISLPRCLKLAVRYILPCKARVHRLTKKYIAWNRSWKRVSTSTWLHGKSSRFSCCHPKSIYLPWRTWFWKISRHWEEHLFILFRPLRKISNSHLVLLVHVSRAGLKPMQPMRLHSDPRHVFG